MTPDRSAEVQPAAGARLHEKTVLYVEDNPANSALMTAIISDLGNVELVSAHTAEVGLILADQCKPDLILMDINLPGMNGMEALSILRTGEHSSHVPVVAISAAAMPADIQRGFDACFNDYIVKPLNIRKTRDSIQRQISL